MTGAAEDERLAWALRLLAAWPDARTDLLDLDLAYVVAGAVALHARERIRAGAPVDDAGVVALFAAIDEAATGPPELWALAAWGVVEVLQDFPEVEPVAAALLGDAGKRLWADVHRFWRGSGA